MIAPVSSARWASGCAPARRGASGCRVAPKAATRQRDAVLDAVADRLRPGEQVIAVLPFAVTPPRPRSQGKVREGIYQTNRRYRPLIATDRRLFVLDAGRTPYPRGVIAEFPLTSIDFLDV